METVGMSVAQTLATPEDMLSVEGSELSGYRYEITREQWDGQVALARLPPSEALTRCPARCPVSRVEVGYGRPVMAEQHGGIAFRARAEMACG
jgi:hypothetical protein